MANKQRELGRGPSPKTNVREFLKKAKKKLESKKSNPKKMERKKLSFWVKITLASVLVSVFSILLFLKRKFKYK